MKSEKGFSLIEMLIYTAILVAVLIVVGFGLLMMTKTFGDIRLLNKINNSAEIAMERMIREIRLANDIDASSIFDVHPGQLKLKTVDSSGNPTTITFYLSEGKLMVQEEGSAGESLTSPRVSVERLVFYQIFNQNISKAIKIEFTINGKNFYDTAVTRGSY